MFKLSSLFLEEGCIDMFHLQHGCHIIITSEISDSVLKTGKSWMEPSLESMGHEAEVYILNFLLQPLKLVLCELAVLKQKDACTQLNSEPFLMASFSCCRCSVVTPVMVWLLLEKVNHEYTFTPTMQAITLLTAVFPHLTVFSAALFC
jgi:hypothetical protein